ncbi:hypothetical protein KFE25_009973 [Diacronema lutheri]|uniref:G-patch domain-containing protein n=1 Tax=Diacronema lutheri TaxID=2081491 RepID=A0A8J5XSG0_DIALT|nr:hypothetical protein KFE25_009973 [Diacronema lutheri]
MPRTKCYEASTSALVATLAAMAGSRHGNVFWEEEKGNVGLRMMQSMGWEHGKGLGSRGHGVTSHIRVRQKKDNAGIGANAATADDAWKATQDVFNSILTRLNDKDAVAAVDKEEKTQSTPTVKQTMARHQLYRKFRAAKNAAEYSATDMAMIFGRRADETGNDDGRSRGGSGESAPDSGHQTTVSTVCMRTYFQMRMRDASGGAPPTASERMGGSAGFTEEFQVSFAHEMTTRAEAYVGRQGLGFAASAGRGARGTLPAAPQHEPCAPAQALVQTPPGSDAKPAQASNRECTRADAGVAGGKRRKLAAGEGDADKPNMKRAIRAVMAGSDARGMKLKLCCARLVAHFGGALSAERVAGLLDERKARKAGFEIVGKRIRRRAAD